MNRHARLLAIGVAALLAACDGGSSSTTPPEPVPGELTLRIDAPGSDDRAMQVNVTGPGPITAVVAASDRYLVLFRESGGTVRAAVFGELRDGAVLRFHVPDVHQASAYTATIVDVADPQNEVRPGPGGYSATIVR